MTGRFNLAIADPNTADGSARVHGLSLRIRTPDGQEWRAAMIDAPFFPVATPQAFYDLQVASARKDDPDAMKNFAAAHPEIGAFGAWPAVLRSRVPTPRTATTVSIASFSPTPRGRTTRCAGLSHPCRPP
ncbi:MAG: hypothetical protein WDM77_14065 [Steroidobacteraceae bacterium]